MCLDFLTGQGGGAEDQALSARIARVIIAGNLVSAPLLNLGSHRPLILQLGEIVEATSLQARYKAKGTVSQTVTFMKVRAAVRSVVQCY